MKAAVLHGPKDIRCEDVPIPRLGVKDVLIKNKAVGICGSDIPRVWAGAAHFYPIILGHEISGEIVEVGEEVEKLSLGDRVAVIPLIPCFTCSACQEGRYSSCRNYSFIGSRRNGGFAEFVSVPETNIIKLPKGVSLEEGALLEPLSVALYALMRGGFTAGEKIAILGLGTIGMLVLQWAKIFGAKMIFCSDIVEQGQDRLRRHLSWERKIFWRSIRKNYSQRNKHNRFLDVIFTTFSRKGLDFKRSFSCEKKD